MKYSLLPLAIVTVLSMTVLSPSTMSAPLAGTAEKVHPLLIGARVPDVNVHTPDGKAVNLRELAGEKPSVLIFYRGGWCPFCNMHLARLQTVESELKELGFQILAISPDQPEALKKGEDKEDASYSLLSDASGEAVRAFGLAYAVAESAAKRYQGNGIHLATTADGKHQLPVPSVFVVNGDGDIAFTYVNPNYKVRLAPEVLLAVATSTVAADAE